MMRVTRSPRGSLRAGAEMAREKKMHTEVRDETFLDIVGSDV